MSLNINTKLTNNLDGYLIDAKNVKGTYVVVSNYSELANLPAATIVEGTLVFCQSDITISDVEYLAGFYQYNNSQWEEVQFGTEVIANPTLAGTEDDLTGLQIGDTKYKVPSGGGNTIDPALIQQLKYCWGTLENSAEHIYKHTFVLHVNANVSVGLAQRNFDIFRIEWLLPFNESLTGLNSEYGGNMSSSASDFFVGIGGKRQPYLLNAYAADLSTWDTENGIDVYDVDHGMPLIYNIVCAKLSQEPGGSLYADMPIIFIPSDSTVESFSLPVYLEVGYTSDSQEVLTLTDTVELVA